MDNERIYEKIGEIANNSNGEKIKGAELAKSIGRVGRSVFRTISAAYRFFYKKGDSTTAENIANVFVDKDGNFPYEK